MASVSKGKSLGKIANKRARPTIQLGGLKVKTTLRKKVSAKKSTASYHEEYKELVELAHDGIVKADTEENIIFSNKSFARNLGYKVNEIVGANLMTFFTNESAKKVKIENKRRVKGRRSSYEVTLIHKNGSSKFFLLSASPLFDSSKRFIGSMGVFSDITKRKLTEEALKKSEAKFRAIIDQSKMGFLLTENGKITFANRRLSKMARVSAPGKLVGQDVKAVMSNLTPESRKRGYDIIDKLRSGKVAPLVNEFSSMLPDGKMEFFQTVSHRFLSKDGYSGQTFVQDVTDRKMMEARLNKKVKQINSLYRVYGHARLAKTFAEVMRGVAEEVAEAFPCTEMPQVEIVFDEISYSYPKKLANLDNQYDVPLEVGGVRRGLLHVAFGKRLGTHKDSNLKKEEKEFLMNVAKILGKHIYAREIMARHKMIVSRSFTAHLLVEDGRIRYANPRFYKMFKCTEEDAMGQDISRFLPVRFLQKKFRDGKVKSCQASRLDGAEIDVEIVVQSVVYHGKPAALIRVNDVTALKQAEAKLKGFNRELKKQVNEKTRHLEKANQRLKKINDVKDEFIAVFSHELRSPLTSIRGYLSFLVEDEALDKLEGPYKEYLRRAYNTTDSLNYLINNILDITRFDMGRFELHTQETDIVKLCQNIVDSLSFQLNEKRLQVEYNNLTRKDNFTLRLDPIRISQVIRNILDNSIKFTKRGKKIFFRIENDGDMLALKIADQGIGIPKAKINKIFDKFMQVQNIHTKYKGGAGLGLFISKRIVELHGGRMEAEKNEYGGTTIGVYLPIK